MLNVVLWQLCGNVLISSESNVVTTSETDVSTTVIFNRATKLWQRQQRRGTTLSQCRCANWITLLWKKEHFSKGEKLCWWQSFHKIFSKRVGYDYLNQIKSTAFIACCMSLFNPSVKRLRVNSKKKKLNHL